MRQVIAYEAADGRRFKSEVECLDYEKFGAFKEWLANQLHGSVTPDGAVSELSAVRRNPIAMHYLASTLDTWRDVKDVVA